MIKARSSLCNFTFKSRACFFTLQSFLELPLVCTMILKRVFAFAVLLTLEKIAVCDGKPNIVIIMADDMASES